VLCLLCAELLSRVAEQHVRAPAKQLQKLLALFLLCLLAELLSDVANGGQVLLDEATFTQVKDSLAVLGTVNDGGYDDVLLQSLMRGQVVDKMKRQVACAAMCVRWE
jgi:hypothetical protein